MTEADFQLAVTSITPIVVAITGVFTARYAWLAHQQGQVNATKIDQVQATTNGTQHALASTLAASQTADQNLIRTAAASKLGVPITAPPIPPKEGS
jgi:hypothetical protein